MNFDMNIQFTYEAETESKLLSMCFFTEKEAKW